jgi:hypothetical protein
MMATPRAIGSSGSFRGSYLDAPPSVSHREIALALGRLASVGALPLGPWGTFGTAPPSKGGAQGTYQRNTDRNSKICISEVNVASSPPVKDRQRNRDCYPHHHATGGVFKNLTVAYPASPRGFAFHKANLSPSPPPFNLGLPVKLYQCRIRTRQPSKSLILLYYNRNTQPMVAGV